MGLSDIFTRLRHRENEQKQTAAQRYAALVLAVAGDEQIDDDEAAQTLAAAGKLADDLAAGVAQEVERRRLIDVARGEEAALAELTSARGAIDSEVARFAELQEAHVAKLKELEQRRSEAEQQHDRIVAAKRKLFTINGGESQEEKDCNAELAIASRRLNACAVGASLQERREAQQEFNRLEEKLKQLGRQREAAAIA